MMYIDFNAGGKQYKLRLNTRNTIGLEKALGGNPLEFFTKLKGDDTPKVETMVTILYYSLKAYNENITIEETFNIFDTWLDEEENSIDGFIAIIVEIYKVSGLIKVKKSVAEKN